jgi:hypothetical protein
MRRPFTTAGMWGLMRVMSDPRCPIRPLPGLSCTAQPSLITDLPSSPAPAPSSGKGPGGPGKNAAPSRNRPAPSVLNLKIRKRLSLRDVHRNGLKLKVTVPKNTRRLRVRLYRLRGSRKVRAGEYVKTIKKGGRVTLRWKTRTTRRLRAGIYLLQVDAGPKKGAYFAGGAQTRIRIVAPAKRRR